MNRPVWDTLLNETRRMHASNADMCEFCVFPTDLTPRDVTPHHTPAAGHFVADSALNGGPFAVCHRALIAAASYARWQELYKDTEIGQEFVDQFAFTCLIGDGGAYGSATMGAWILYMPANTHYTWHHHIAEEAYMVIAGSARFFRHGMPDETLMPGDTIEHQSNQPHAMETGDSPVLCYITWRNGFDHLPVLSKAEDFK